MFIISIHVQQLMDIQRSVCVRVWEPGWSSMIVEGLSSVICSSEHQDHLGVSCRFKTSSQKCFAEFNLGFPHQFFQPTTLHNIANFIQDSFHPDTWPNK